MGMSYNKYSRFAIHHRLRAYVLILPVALIVLITANLSQLAGSGTLYYKLVVALICGGLCYLAGAAHLFPLVEYHKKKEILNKLVETNNYPSKELLIGWQEIYNPATNQATTSILKTLFSPSVVLLAFIVGAVQVLLDNWINNGLQYWDIAIHAVAVSVVVWLMNVLLINVLQLKTLVQNMRYTTGGDKYITIISHEKLHKKFKKLNKMVDEELSKRHELNQPLVWLHQTIAGYVSLHDDVVELQRIINDNIRMGTVELNDLQSEIKAMQKISDEDIPKIAAEMTDFIESYDDNVAACHVLAEKLTDSRDSYNTNVKALIADVKAMLEKAQQLIEQKKQLQLAMDARLDELASIGFEHQGSYDEFYKLEFDSLEKKVVANNLVMSMLPELEKSLAMVKGKDPKLEDEINNQIEDIKLFIKSIAKDTPENIESRAKALDARSRDLLAFDIPTTVNNDIANQLAVNERYLKQREQLSH